MLFTIAGCSNDSNNDSEPDLSVFSIVETLATDDMGGRDNLSLGSLLAQSFLYDELVKIAQPIFPAETGIEGYLQPYELGTNVLAIVPGGELADEYVMIGAHYDATATGTVRGGSAFWVATLRTLECDAFLAED